MAEKLKMLMDIFGKITFGVLMACLLYTSLFRGGVKTGKGRLSGVLLCERKDRRGQCLRAGCNESGKRRRNFHFAEAGRKWYDDRNCKIRLEIGKRTGKGVQDR